MSAVDRDELIVRMKKASTAVYLAVPESVADDLSALLKAGAEALDALAASEARAVVCEHQSDNYLAMMRERDQAKERAERAERAINEALRLYADPDAIGTSEQMYIALSGDREPNLDEAGS